MTIARWSARRWTAALIGLVVTGLIIGVPTGIIETPFYQRMTPVEWWNYPVWVLSSGLTGLLFATYVRSPIAKDSTSSFGIGGGALSLLAVGCPVCNKIVVAAIGISGAMNLWAPVQPVLGVLSLGLLGWALSMRLRGELACTFGGADSPTQKVTAEPDGTSA